MLDYIEDHFSDDISLKELANIFSINFSYSCVLFKKVTGRTFSEYLTDARMKKAVEFLSDKTLSIAVICFRIGYNDYYYFNKVFKKHYGITPLSYRKIKCK